MNIWKLLSKKYYYYFNSFKKYNKLKFKYLNNNFNWIQNYRANDLLKVIMFNFYENLGFLGKPWQTVWCKADIMIPCEYQLFSWTIDTEF